MTERLSRAAVAVLKFFFGMASNLKPRLEALAVYLKQCENEGNFADLRKQQFDLLLSSLETQLAALSFSDGADYVAILRSMSWSEEQRTSLVKLVQDKVLAGQQQVPVGGRQFSQDFTSLLHKFPSRRLEETHGPHFAIAIVESAPDRAGDPPEQTDVTFRFGGNLGGLNGLIAAAW